MRNNYLSLNKRKRQTGETIMWGAVW